MFNLSCVKFSRALIVMEELRRQINLWEVTKWEIILDWKWIFTWNFASEIILQKDIFPDNYTKIDAEMVEKIVFQTMAKKKITRRDLVAICND